MLVVKTSCLELPKKYYRRADDKVVAYFEGFKAVAELNEEAFNEDEECDLTKCLCIRSFVEDMTVEEAFENGYWEFFSNNPFADEMIEIMDELVAYDLHILDEGDILCVVNEEGKIYEYTRNEI